MDLHNLYQKTENEEVIKWSGKDNGFSVLRDYPLDKGFIPVKNKEGEYDTKALIKVGYSIDNPSEKKYRVFASVSKYSKYLSDHFRYDFGDESNSPSKEEILASENSKQPVELEDNGRYELDLSTNTIFDKELKRNVTVNEIVNTIYNLHISTISGYKSIIFKSKIGLRNKITENIIPYFVTKLEWVNKNLFGKDIVKSKENWLSGIFSVYPYSSLQTLYPQNIPFFEDKIGLKTSKQGILWIALAILFLTYSGCLKDFLTITEISLTIVLNVIFDTVLPYTVLFVINRLIVVKVWFYSFKIKIK